MKGSELDEAHDATGPGCGAKGAPEQQARYMYQPWISAAPRTNDASIRDLHLVITEHVDTQVFPG